MSALGVAVIGSVSSRTHDEFSDCDLVALYPDTLPGSNVKALLRRVEASLCVPQELEIEWRIASKRWMSLDHARGGWDAWRLFRTGRALIPTDDLAFFLTHQPSDVDPSLEVAAAKYLACEYAFFCSERFEDIVADMLLLYGLIRRVNIAVGGTRPETIHFGLDGIFHSRLSSSKPSFSPATLRQVCLAARKMKCGFAPDAENVGRARQLADEIVAFVKELPSLRDPEPGPFEMPIKVLAGARRLNYVFAQRLPLAPFPLTTSKKAVGQWRAQLEASYPALNAACVVEAYERLWSLASGKGAVDVNALERPIDAVLRLASERPVASSRQ